MQSVRTRVGVESVVLRDAIRLLDKVDSETVVVDRISGYHRRTAIIDAHKALFTVQAEVGLSAYAVGPTSEPPMSLLEPETGQQLQRLRVA